MPTSSLSQIVYDLPMITPIVSSNTNITVGLDFFFNMPLIYLFIPVPILIIFIEV